MHVPSFIRNLTSVPKLVLMFTIAAVVCLVAPSEAFGSTHTQGGYTVKLLSGATATCPTGQYCLAPSVGNDDVVLAVAHGRQTASSLVVTVYLAASNALDPGDELDIEGLGGHVNLGTTALNTVTLTAQQPYQSQFIGTLTAPGAHSLHVFAASGSFTVTSVTIAAVP